LYTAAIGRAPRQYAVGLVTGLPENKFAPRSNGAHSLCQCLGGGKVGLGLTPGEFRWEDFGSSALITDLGAVGRTTTELDRFGHSLLARQCTTTL